ncbi:uncharacterized protein O3C94_012980 [Discoglossus pictus]
MKMKYLHWILIVIYFQRDILCKTDCGDPDHINGAEGGDIILQVDRTEIRDISWVLDNKHFATTELGGKIRPRGIKLFEGRIYGTSDGSLNITKLSSRDQGIYTTNILITSGGAPCKEYHLRVYRKLSEEDFWISSNNTNSNYSVTLTCHVNESDVTISWNNISISDKLVTNHTLHVSNENLNLSYTCTAKNPVSNVSRSITPWTLFGKAGDDKRMKNQRNHILHYITIDLSLLFLLLLLLLVIYVIWRKKCKKSENLMQQQGTVYAQVQKPDKENTYVSENPATNPKPAETVYSQITHPKINQQNSLESSTSQGNMPAAATVYSEIEQPKENSSVDRYSKEDNTVHKNKKHPQSTESEYEKVQHPQVKGANGTTPKKLPETVYDTIEMKHVI